MQISYPPAPYDIGNTPPMSGDDPAPVPYFSIPAMAALLISGCCVKPK